MFLLPGANKDYEVGPTDVLRYLRDNTDVRSRHAAYGKSQTIRAVSEFVGKNKTLRLDSRTLLYQVASFYCAFWSVNLRYLQDIFTGFEQ